jgi:diaminopimelate epimerase
MPAGPGLSSPAMLLEFTKMSGAGNDFILFDNRDGKIALTTEQIVRLCHRQFGIGADGIMGLVPCASGKADWSWQFFNNDGSAAEMCGNGARCFGRYIQRLTGAKGDISFETIAGVIRAGFDGDRVTVNLTAPQGLRLNETVPLAQGPTPIHSLNTGVPHAIVYVDDADRAMVGPVGSEVRYHAHFKPRGTNVNFVQVKGQDFIRVRTYERGVEGETLACGTGVTAAALISAKLKGFKSPVKVQVQGGDLLEVGFTETNGEFGDVKLTGPATFVFEGRIEV